VSKDRTVFRVALKHSSEASNVPYYAGWMPVVWLLLFELEEENVCLHVDLCVVKRIKWHMYITHNKQNYAVQSLLVLQVDYGDHHSSLQ